MPKRDSLIWPSADGDTFVYAKINIEEETSYSDSSGSTPTLPHNVSLQRLDHKSSYIVVSGHDLWKI